MTVDVNDLGQPVGALVPDWQPALWPGADVMTGQYCRVERLNPSVHTTELFSANSIDAHNANWTYLPYGPFTDLQSYRSWTDDVAGSSDPIFFSVIDQSTGRATGVASYLRINPDAGSIEVGHINYSPLLQRQRAGTEAMYLMMRNAFDILGYRRYEWKCNDLNSASKAAAVRLGFVYEGTFRHSGIVKGRNRDTAWFSVIDREWPPIKQSLQTWLDHSNFEADGRQRTPLRTNPLSD